MIIRTLTPLALLVTATLGLTACEGPPKTSAPPLPQPSAAAATLAAAAPTAALTPAAASKPKAVLYEPLQAYADQVVSQLSTIPEDRKKSLEKLALFVKTKRAAGEDAKLTFICTHNSRRSHLAQLWSTTAAAYYGVDGVETYSGGTEATAFNPRAVATVERAGFRLEKPEGENPHYRVTYGPSLPAVEAFSKKYNDPFNPQENFAAVMTCTQADKNCPTVEGASLRVAVPYEDPKVADGTPEEAATYDARSKQIATEMFYLFSRVAS